MAGPIVLDQIKVKLVDARIANTPFNSSNVKVHLWKGAGSPDHTATYSSLLADDPVFTGYAAQTVTGWSAPAVLGADFIARSVGAPVTFTNSGGAASESITGWWLEDSSGILGILFGKFPLPFVIPAGSPFTFTPIWEGTGENLTT